MNAEETLQSLLKEVIDISSSEIKPDETLDTAYGVDSTEMVEISVGLKKALSLDIGDNEIKKTHTYNEIIGILKNKGAN